MANKKIRVRDLAAELDIPIKEFLTKLQEVGLGDKFTRTTGMREGMADKFREHYVNGAPLDIYPEKPKGGGVAKEPVPPRPLDPRDVERLKVARTKVQLGIATDMDLHTIQVLENLEQLGVRKAVERNRKRRRATGNPKKAKKLARNQQTEANLRRQIEAKERAAAYWRDEAGKAAAEKKVQDRERMFTEVAEQSAGAGTPRRFDGRVGTVVSGGLPSLGSRRN